LPIAVVLATALAAVLQDGAAPPRASSQSDHDLTQLSLEELMHVDVEVTSVSRRPQRASESAAAIFVLTQEEIRRSGATSLPEVLRLVPGMQVARISSNTWAISVRGFDGQYSNKLLVLVDGRSVYTPLFSGVFWDVQDLMLEDVERIEVIRGPGATLWGANAVNGVVNVITKSAKETQGGLLSATVGTQERTILGARYGVALSDQSWLRVFAKWSDHGAFHDPASGTPDDDWCQARTGFRSDWDVTTRDRLVCEGEAYVGDFDGAIMNNQPTPPFQTTNPVFGVVRGEHALARLERASSATSDSALQLYLDRYDREIGALGQTVDTLDLDWQHHFRLTASDDVVWGLGWRHMRSELDGTFDASLHHSRHDDDLWSAFVQDEHALVPERLRLTVGSKFEHNSYTGFELQPSGRLAFTPTATQTWWAAVSRAVRTPSVVERDGVVNFAVMPGVPFPTVVQFQGDHGFGSERLLAYELGWREQASDALSFDVATFYHHYDDLSSLEPGTPFLSGGTVVAPQFFANGLHGRTYGVEPAVEWRVVPTWTLDASYALLELDAKRDSGSNDTGSAATARRSVPNQQVQFRSLWNVTDQVEFDVTAYYVDSIPEYAVSSYVRVDARLGWRVTPRCDLSLVAQGLFHDEGREFGSTFLVRETRPPAGVYLRWTQRF
jgi:iron complex outermembrane receptor protein